MMMSDSEMRVQALAKAGNSPHKDDQILFKSCHAILFFGVPNTGLEVESLKTMVKGQPNARLIADLEVSSGFLDLLVSHWDTARVEIIDTRVVSIYETKPTKTVEVNSSTEYIG